MKNFTKQILNKTLFKPTRWLLVALMFLLGTGSAWAYNQSAVDLYFDNSEAKWSNCYVYIGHSTWTSCYPLTRVSGTQYLWKLAKANFNGGSAWNGATGWVLCNEKWWDNQGESIDKFTWHGDKNVTQKRTSAWSASYIYKTNGTASTTSDNHTITAYKTTTVSNKNYTVTINTATGGTLTVKDYDNNTVSNGASKIYLTVLKFSASASSGYDFTGVQIDNGSTTTTISKADLATKTYTITSNVTITPVWAAKQYAITYKDQGNVAFSGTHASGYPTTHTYGTATTLKSATKSGYNFLGWFTTSACDGTKVTLLGATAYTADITLYAKWEKACDDVAAPTLSIYKKIVDKCGSITQGYIKIDNYASYSNCTFYLGNENQPITPTNDGLIGISIANTYTVIVKNSCGNKNNSAIAIETDVITAPNKYTVSASIPQIAFANNDGSINIELAGSDNGVTYNLYKDDAKIAGTTKTGDGNALQWTGITSPGVYTVKADNPCNDGVEAMTGSFKQECINGLKLAFENGIDTYCANTETNIVITYNGTSFDQYTNPGKYGYKWTISSGSLSYTSVIPKIGAKLPVNIKNTGTIQLQMKSCGSTIESNVLSFNVYTTPAEPKFSFSSANVGQNKTTTLILDSYNPDLTYEYYKATTKLGNITSKETIINVGNETGTFTYKVIATDKTCDGLTSESTATLTVSEAGAKIDALGATALFTNDPTHFIPMYVEKDGIVDVEGATKVTGYTWEFSEDGSTNWTACNYTYANFNAKNNKSEHKVVVTNGDKDCNNWRANAVGYYRCKMTYDTGASQYSNSIQVTAGTNSNTNKQHIGITYNLPIISVNTGDKDFPSDASLSGYPSASADDLKKKRSVDVKIFNPDGTVCYDRKARMAYRGSSSLNFQKKSYAFCPGKAKCGDEEKSVDYVKTSKENLFGLSNGAEDKDWVLYAATPEPSMMRNRLTFDLYKEMRPQDWGVNSMYVELVINGEYKGVYVLMDKITQNKNRVKLSSADAFIVKFDKTDCADRIGGYNGKVGDEKTFITSKSGKFGIDTYDTKVDQAFEIEYPEKEDFEDVNVGSWVPFTDKVKEKFVQFETALEKKDYTTVRSIIDYDSWADWYILTEFIKNQDGFRASNIFVYDGEKIEARPLWDQELSFNNQARISHSCDKTAGLLITTSSIYEDHFKAPFWFTGGNNSITGGLLSDPCFVSLVKQKWAEYSQDGGLLTKSHIESKVSAYDSELGAAQSREAARWPYTGAVRGMTNNGKTIGYYGKNEGIEIGYADSKSDILSWANGRVGGLTTALNGLEGEALIFTMTPSVEVTPWQIGIINIHAPAGYTYTVDFSQVENAGGYVTNDNATYSVKLPRPIDWAQGGNGSTTLSKTYTVTAKLELDSEENTCGFTSTENTKDSVITLKDETEECDPEVTR